jgi:hypothetical protein
MLTNDHRSSARCPTKMNFPNESEPALARILQLQDRRVNKERHQYTGSQLKIIKYQI